jgi:hypothetical protein
MSVEELPRRVVICSSPYRRAFFRWVTGRPITSEEYRWLQRGAIGEGYEMPTSYVPRDYKRPRDV